MPPLNQASRIEQRAPATRLTSYGFWIGEILDSYAHLGIMKVMPPGGTPVMGVPLSSTGQFLLGAKDLALFPPGTRALCFLEPGSRIAVIMGALPKSTRDGYRNGAPDWVVPCSHAGIGDDGVHNITLSLFAERSGLFNMSTGKPCDQLPGDGGMVNELGIGLLMGRASIQLRASHFCGVQAHFFDNLLRILGANYELMTSGEERRALNDEGEYTSIRRWTSYPWESMGSTALEGVTSRCTLDLDGTWKSGMSEAAREPMEVDQQGIYRVLELEGYLGDLRKLYVSAPPEVMTSVVEKESNSTVYRGLLEQSIGLDGRYTLRSAKGIILEKTCAIPIPKEIHVPEDPEGDNERNYKAAGIWGEGDAHTRTELALADETPGTRSSVAYEMHAHLFNLQAVVPLYYHKKDWFLPTEQQAAQALGFETSTYDIPDSPAFWMTLPEKKTIKLDHRASASYYRSRAIFAMQDDGSILLEDGYGSQLRMEGGQIFLSAPGDVFLQPGRSVIAWAPRDIVLRAGHSADLTAGKGDVRIKAQNNLQMVSVDQGVLIESQSTADASPDWKETGEGVRSSGVILKAADSHVSSFSKDVYIRAGVKDEHKTSCQMHLDAGQALGQMTLQGDKITARAYNEFAVVMKSAGTEPADAEGIVSATFNSREVVFGGKGLQQITLGAPMVVVCSPERETGVLAVQGNLAVKGEQFTQGHALFGQNMLLGGSLSVGQFLQCRNLMASGTIYADTLVQDERHGRFVMPAGEDKVTKKRIRDNVPMAPTAEQLNYANALVEQGLKRIAERTQLDADWVGRLLDILYAGTTIWPSEDDLQNYVFFTFRKPVEYLTEQGFYLFETRWQQRLRALGRLRTWDEPELERADGTITRPHPGQEVWAGEAGLSIVQSDNALTDPVTGFAVERSALQAATTLSHQVASLQEQYLVNYQE